jgi:hypothetical protein
LDKPLLVFDPGRRNLFALDDDWRNEAGSYGFGAFRARLLIRDELPPAETVFSRRTGLRTIGSSGTSWPCNGSAPFKTSAAIE